MNTLEEEVVVENRAPKWVLELAEEVGREVERLVTAAPVVPNCINNKFELMRAVEARRHFESLRGGEAEYILPGKREDVFVGDKRNSTKVETFAHLKKMCNEIVTMWSIEDYVGTESLIRAKIPDNYVGKIGEVRLKDLDESQLNSVKLSRDGDLLIMCLKEKTFFTDEKFGLLTGDRINQEYGYVNFYIQSGMLLNWSVGPDPGAVPVQDLEHEYVSLN